MPPTARQLARCTLWAWPCTPSTAKSAFGAPGDDAGGLPAASRRAGPYPAAFTEDRTRRSVPTGQASDRAGTVILATTSAVAATVNAVIVSTSTTPTAGATWPVDSVRAYHDRDGRHHTTLTLGGRR